MPSQAVYNESVKTAIVEDLWASIDDGREGIVIFLIGKDLFKDYKYGDTILFSDKSDLIIPVTGLVVGEFDNTDKILGPLGTKAIRVTVLDADFLDSSLGTVFNTGKMSGGVNIFNDTLPPVAAQNPVTDGDAGTFSSGGSTRFGSPLSIFDRSTE